MEALPVLNSSPEEVALVFKAARKSGRPSKGHMGDLRAQEGISTRGELKKARAKIYSSQSKIAKKGETAKAKRIAENLEKSSNASIEDDRLIIRRDRSKLTPIPRNSL